MTRFEFETFDKMRAKLDRASASLFVLSECVEWQKGGRVGGAILADAVRAVLDQLEEMKALMQQAEAEMRNVRKGGNDEERA